MSTFVCALAHDSEALCHVVVTAMIALSLVGRQTGRERGRSTFVRALAHDSEALCHGFVTATISLSSYQYSSLFVMAVLILLHLSIQLLGIHMSLKPRARSFTCVLGSRAFQRHCRTSYARLLATSMCLVLLLGWFWRFAAVHTVSVFFCAGSSLGWKEVPSMRWLHLAISIGELIAR